MDVPALEPLRTLATDFRRAIEQSRAERDVPHLPYFPEGACRLTSRLLALHLARHDHQAVRLASGRLPGFDTPVRHSWLLVEDMVVDLTADPFGEAPVIVGAPTQFHSSLTEYEERPAAEDLARCTADEQARFARLLGPIEARLSARTNSQA
jgi:hypothetical protein